MNSDWRRTCSAAESARAIPARSRLWSGGSLELIGDLQQGEEFTLQLVELLIEQKRYKAFLKGGSREAMLRHAVTPDRDCGARPTASSRKIADKCSLGRAGAPCGHRADHEIPRAVKNRSGQPDRGLRIDELFMRPAR